MLQYIAVLFFYALLSFYIIQNLNPHYSILLLPLAFFTGLRFYRGDSATAAEPEEKITEPSDQKQVLLDPVEMQERLKLVIDGTNDGIWDWEVRNNKVLWSDRVYQLVGLDKGSLGENFESAKDLMHPEDKSSFDKALRNHLVYNSPFTVEVRIRSRDLSYRYFLVRGKAQRSKQGKPIRMAGSISDITERKLAETRLRHNAYHDHLTDLPNRSFFMDELTKVLFKAHENPDYIFGVLLMDLDKFKLINDNLGHVIGDKLLFEMGQRLESCLRTNDILARIGGDEFGIIINNIRQAGDATHLSARIKSEMSKPFVVNNKEIFLSSCMGIVFNNESHNSIESMVQDANTVLAQAKRKGQGCIEVFSQSMRERELVTYKIESGLRQALDRGELFLVYQPIFNLKTRKLEAFEALVRWHNPELGFIRPTEFIPVAEESGLILSIGEWILRTACAQMKSWEEMGFTDLVISVNVAAPQFTHQDVPNLTKRVLRDTGLDPKNLKLEITESVAMKDVSKTIETLEHLNQMGLGISIDDFGTGYSSLSYLKQYPIHTLKIDRSFVMDIPHDPDNMSITSTIIAMAKNLNLSIIAEGVENEDQIAFLEEHDCDQVQGFYFSKPLNTEDTLALLQEEFFRE